MNRHPPNACWGVAVFMEFVYILCDEKFVAAFDARLGSYLSW